ncbi:apolipoprotein A-I-like [Eublepharis macularius]|uniref:Apolipoprotein A-I-like n=1 Tax=Eublepharis macularius TaxID=481883 RepID=A0AA97LLB8_EUBMA|nr:apolipoprotein A-I-like [Eublepharis macularius]
MKLFAITLALAIFTGSWDSVLGNEPISKLEQLMQNIDEYFTDIKRGIEELVAVVTESDLAHEIKDFLDEGYSNISQRHRTVDDLPSEVIEIIKLVLDIPTTVAGSVLFSHSKVTNRVRAVMEEVYEMLEPVVSPFAKPVEDQVRTYADALRTKIEELIEKQKDKLKLQVEELETKVGPYVKNVQNQLRELWVALQPVADKVWERLKEDVESATNSLKPYVGPVLEKLGEYHQDFKNWVISFISPIFS